MGRDIENAKCRQLFRGEFLLEEKNTKWKVLEGEVGPRKELNKQWIVRNNSMYVIQWNGLVERYYITIHDAGRRKEIVGTLE